MILLRGRQPEMLASLIADLETHTRILAVAPGGIGKTTLMGALSKHLWETKQVRVLVLENRDRLTRQTADRLGSETGLECDVEMADSHASPFAPLVVASVQSLGRPNRLLGFSDDHFGLVIADECHLCLAPQWQRIMNYFHYGASSLEDNWVKPNDGAYIPKAKIAGFTASPDLGDRRNLGTVFKKLSVNYSYLDAIDDGWLVSIKEMNVPVKIDTRKFRVKKSAEGATFDAADQSAAIEPIIGELADQIVTYAADRKGMMFVPSVEIARQMADALNARGIYSVFVSGECIDKGPKTDAFMAAKKGWLVNCALYCYGLDIVDLDAVAPFGAILSKVKYIQCIYRGTRVLPGVVSDSMTAEERVAAIAASAKPHLLVLSPFFISDRIHIMEVYDLFGIPPDPKRAQKDKKNFADTKKIRDYIARLEKEADKHRNKQSRTIDPISFALSIGDQALANYRPETVTEASPPTREMLDFLLDRGIDTVKIGTMGQAQKIVDRLRERERLGLASPKALGQLRLRLGYPEERAALISSKQAGVLIWKGIRYRPPREIFTGA